MKIVRKFVWLLLTLGLLVLVVQTASPIALGLAACMVLLPLLCLPMNLYAAKKLKLTVRLPVNLRKGEGGTAELTVYLLSILRLIQPNLLLPATTALGTIQPNGRELGLAAGANVVMPNLSPLSVRKKYALYDGKICTGEEGAQCVGCLQGRVASVGYTLVSSRGDIRTI